MHLLLASASPRRKDLLAAAGIALVVHPVDCDESWQTGEHPEAYTRRLALAKAQLAQTTWPDHEGPILGADTTVWCSPAGPPLGKPDGRHQARALLSSLTAGTSHYVTTAYCLIPSQSLPVLEHTTTRVWMRPLSPAAIEAYLDTGEWQGKAGGYAIQGHAAALVLEIEGSYTGVVGLPVAHVLETMRDHNCLPPPICKGSP